MSTNCATKAAEFCRNAQESCDARYRAHASCSAQIDALDHCAALSPVSNFSCPLGTIADEVRPYRLSEDACVPEGEAFKSCL